MLLKITNIILFLLCILSIYLILFKSTFDILQIPSLTSLFLWSISVFSKINPRISSKIMIYLKGFFLNTEVQVTCNVQTTFSEFQDYIYDLNKRIGNFYNIEMQVKENNDQVFFKVCRKGESPIEFRINPKYDNEYNLKSIYLSFEKIQNRHSAILNYCKKINNLVRVFENQSKSSNIEIQINYEKGKNPIIKELLKGSKLENIIFKNKNLNISSNQLFISCKTIDFENEVLNALTGGL